MTKAPQYHHGNLREALLRAAWKEVRKHGIAGLTLRSLAKACGVSHGAPGHHFASKQALVDALADDGFRELDHAIVKSLRLASTPREKLYQIGDAYIVFGCKHPERFDVMFQRPIGIVSDETMQASGRVFEHLVAALSEAQASGEASVNSDVWDLALHAWTVVHGFAVLASSQLLGIDRYRERISALRHETLLRVIDSLQQPLSLP